MRSRGPKAVASLLLALAVGGGVGVVIAGGSPESASGQLVCTVLVCTTDTTTTDTLPTTPTLPTTTSTPPPTTAPADSDGDGVPDDRDNCVQAANPDQADAERDGIGDACDRDQDNDGISNDAEAVIGSSPVDLDSDDDGLPDSYEERRSLEPGRPDSDHDRVPDGVEMGLRRGVPDPPGAVRGTDLARFHRDLAPQNVSSPMKRDSDGDGLADGREDRNHNGRRDRTETDPIKRDTDRDGVPDGADRFPLDPRR